MKLHDYFMMCMDKEMYRNRKWIIRCFTIIPRDNETTEEMIPSFKDGKCFFTDTEGQEHELEDYVFRKELFHLTNAVTVTPQEFPHFEKEMKTSYGNMVVGSCIYTWALGNKLPFYNDDKPWSIKDLDKQIAAGIKEGILSIDKEYKDYIKALDHCSVFTDFVVPTGDVGMFLPNKDVLKVRDELLKKYEGRLHEPAIAALVEQEINKANREKMKGSPGEGFLISGKLMDTVQKKMNYVQGINTDISDPSKVAFIESSLTEGWKKDDLHRMINALRSGSYSRGADTAMGGLATKQILRYSGNIKVNIDDCGTDLGIPITYTKDDYKLFEGRIEAKTNKVIVPKAGMSVIMRDPGTCKAPGNNFCKKCVGEVVGSLDIGIGSQLLATTGSMLKAFLAAFHAKTITLHTLDYNMSFR